MLAKLVIISAAFATALAAGGCSMFRDGAPRPRNAMLHGDDAPVLSLVEATTAAAPRGSASAYAAATPNELSQSIESRSVLFALHLASYRSVEQAEAGWRILTTEAPSELASLHPRVEAVDLGPERGVFHRLKAGPLDSRADAAARCAALESAGHYCQTIDFEGRDIAG